MENLINDDCFNILPNIENDSVQLLFTSVPDINDLGYDANQDQYLEFLDKALVEFCRITKKTGFIVLCQSDRKMKGKIFSKHSYIINKMQDLDYILKDYKIVVKNNIESKDQYIFPYLHLCVFTREGTISRKGEWLRNILVYKMIKSAIGSHHDWPEEFVKLVISYLSNEDDLVVDPFAGSGVVPCVARDMDRKYLGIELDKPQYEEMYQRCSTSTLPF